MIKFKRKRAPARVKPEKSFVEIVSVDLLVWWLFFGFRREQHNSPLTLHRVSPVQQSSNAAITISRSTYRLGFRFLSENSPMERFFDVVFNDTMFLYFLTPHAFLLFSCLLFLFSLLFLPPPPLLSFFISFVVTICFLVA